MIDHGDKRFEAALRILVSQLEAVMNEPGPTRWPDSNTVKAMSSAAVSTADMLLADLRKEKP